jgi:hypothetical protein
MIMKLTESLNDNPWQAAANLTLQASWRDEIERAIANQKRTELDKYLRRLWYRAAAQRRRRIRGQTCRNQTA